MSQSLLVQLCLLYTILRSDVRGLDLSSSLLPDWDTVAQIAIELPFLERLSLKFVPVWTLEAPRTYHVISSRNRFCPHTNSQRMKTGFLNVTDLYISSTLMSWCDMEKVTIFMPQLRLVEMGYNCIESLSEYGSPLTPKPDIQSVNLDGNECRKWHHVCYSLYPYRS